MSFARHLILGFLPLFGFAVCLLGQSDSGLVIKVNSRLVEVYASVYDSKGHYVDQLRRPNFQVIENGKPQLIRDFEDNVQSLSCAILLDSTGSMADVLPNVKNSIVQLIDQLTPQDSVALYTFDQSMSVRQDFTTNKAAAKRSVLRVRAGGRTALFDSLSEAGQELSRRPGKKVLILFTDGDDNSSMLNATAAITRAERLGIPLYAVAEGEATRSKRLRKMLDDLSERTGGSSYVIRKASDITDVFQSIARDIRHMYLLTYDPPLEPADGKWREIQVAVNGGEHYRVRAKQGYFPGW
jgi:Ca-activated chloride channel homolog